MANALAIRRLCHRSTSPFPVSTFLSLLNSRHYNVIGVAGYRYLPYFKQTSVGQFLESSFNYSVVQNNVIGLKFGLTCPFQPLFSTAAEAILIQARDPSRLVVDLDNAIDEQRFEDACRVYERYRQLESFPRKSILNKLIIGLGESGNLQCLDKAYKLVELAFDENKHELLQKGSLIYISFILARNGLPVPASTILRKMLEIEEYPPVMAWSGIIAHMSQTAPGAYLAAEIIRQIGYFFKDNKVDPRKKSNILLLSMKPNTAVFNIALCGCLLSGSTRKAEQLLELVPRIGVKTDATLLIIMAHIFEKNRRIDEIKKLKRHVDEACSLGDLQFQQFYNCLLSCHLNLGDLDSASELVLDMLRKAREAQNSLASVTLAFESVGTKKLDHTQSDEHEKSKTNTVLDKIILINGPAPSYLEFSNDRNFIRLEAEAKELLDMLLSQLQIQVELVKSVGGILHPTERIYVKLVRAFLEADRVKDLAEFLIKAEREQAPVSIENSVVFHVINACTSLGWLDQAHDLIDEMRLAGIKTGSSVYSSLLKAYCKYNRPSEVVSLLRDARKAGIQLDSSCYEALIRFRVIQKDTSGALSLFREMKEGKVSMVGHWEFDTLLEGCAQSGEPGFMVKLMEEIKGEQRLDCGVEDWNNVIHFFCKKRLMTDAQKALKKMKALGHQPNAQTYHSLVTGYAAAGGKYQEITELWGEMKIIAASKASIKFDQELLDSLLYSFVRGGFFQRANEVVKLMEGGRMFIDKYKYRNLFLKYHKTLYKSKKASKFQTEAQSKKREEALVFKEWAGLV